MCVGSVMPLIWINGNSTVETSRAICRSASGSENQSAWIPISMTRQSKEKIGRNSPCPCGSGTKYKKCHGNMSEKPTGPHLDKIREILASHEAKEACRINQQGQGKPIISAEMNGTRFTAVGSRLHYSRTHKTFVDFLGDYIRSVLGADWGNSEIAKPLEQRHQILRWYNDICLLQQENMKRPRGELQEFPANGLTQCYYGLAYNLYLLQHNAELQNYLVNRLKNPDSFYAAYYETYVSAWFILAGFELRIENEADSTKTHPEFIATRGSETYSVEAKSRKEGKDHFQVGNQIYKALCKESQHPRVVFIDMNVGKDANLETLRDEVMTVVRDKEKGMRIHGNPAPPAYIFITNQPLHLAPNEVRLPRFCLSTGFKIPDYSFGSQFSSLTSAYKAKQRHSAMFDVQAAFSRYSIPSTFDGEIPEFAFGKATRRFVIGDSVEVSDGIRLKIQSGIVNEQEKRAYLILAGSHGGSHIYTSDLTEEELSAYRAHPETFFGRVVSVSKSIDDPLALFEFFVEGYRTTPREKLLEFMSKAPDIEKYKELPAEDLLYVYAEGLTYSALRKR